jgi:LmbE family N-acetylglucosaminyl deacetylase
MISLVPQNLRRILALGCHADDIEIGVGGTLLRLLAEHAGLHVTWVVMSAAGERRAEAQASAEQFLERAGSREIIIADFRDRFFPFQAEAIKEFLHQVADKTQPDLVFTHRLEDRHQDHRTVAEFTWHALRNHLVCEYEIPKYEGDLGQPNLFVPLAREVCERKIAITHESFASQRDKPWFTPDTFWALLRLRGLECNSPTRFAEGLYCRKMVM